MPYLSSVSRQELLAYLILLNVAVEEVDLWREEWFLAVKWQLPVGSVVFVPTSRTDGREFEPSSWSQPACLGEEVEQQGYAGP